MQIEIKLNTALHYAVEAANDVAVKALLEPLPADKEKGVAAGAQSQGHGYTYPQPNLHSALSPSLSCTPRAAREQGQAGQQRLQQTGASEMDAFD